MAKNVKTQGRKSNGEGSIFYQESRKRWVAQIQWTDSFGKRNTKVFTGAKRSDVKTKLDAFRKQLLIGDPIKGITSELTFEEYSAGWLRGQRHTLKPSSYDRIETSLKYQVNPLIGNVPIDAIITETVQEMVNDLADKEYSYSTIKKAFDAVNSCLREYRSKKRSGFNPCEAVKLPSAKKKETSEIQFFEHPEREALCKECVRTYSNGKPVHRLGQAVIFLMYTGLRIGELSALTWNDIDFEDKIMYIKGNSVVVKNRNKKSPNDKSYVLIDQDSTKTEEGKRPVPLPEKALDALVKLRDLNGKFKYVMSTEKGTRASPRTFARTFYKIQEQSGVAKKLNRTYGLHSLRHTFASMMFDNGCEVKVVSELLGHSDTAITENTYIHVIKRQKIKAIESIDRFVS